MPVSDKGDVGEDEWVSETAKRIVDSRMEDIALFFLGTMGPTSHVWSQVARLYFQPLFILMGPESERLLAFAEKPENVEKLVKRIEEIKLQKEKALMKAEKQKPKNWKA
jgi:hypothetical protein